MSCATPSIRPIAHEQPKTASAFFGSYRAESIQSSGAMSLPLTLLKQLGVAHKWCESLTKLLPHEQNWCENKLDDWLDEHLPKLGTPQRKLIKDGLAIAAYRTQTTCPVVGL